MPTNVELFDMLEPGILAGMTEAELEAELAKAGQMRQAVYDYRKTVCDALWELRQRPLTPEPFSGART